MIDLDKGIDAAIDAAKSEPWLRTPEVMRMSMLHVSETRGSRLPKL